MTRCLRCGRPVMSQLVYLERDETYRCAQCRLNEAAACGLLERMRDGAANEKGE